MMTTNMIKSEDDRGIQVVEVQSRQAMSVIDQSMTVAQLEGLFNRIKEFQSKVMKDGTHYGEIPGTKNKSLWKAGADTLQVAFNLGHEFIVEDLSTSDCFRYRVRARIIHTVTGKFLGEGIGEASTDEEKYKWRSPVGGEFEDTPVDRRREKWRKSGYDENGRFSSSPLKIKQVRTDFYDQANTVLKMAAKRAKIDAILTVTGCGDLFSDDDDVESTEVRKSNTAEYKCSKCQAVVDDQVRSFSIKNYSECLCRKCQGVIKETMKGVSQ